VSVAKDVLDEGTCMNAQSLAGQTGVADWSQLSGGGPSDSLSRAIRQYWNTHIHDVSVTRHPVGSAAFFQALDEYRFDKLRYLPHVVDFSAHRGKNLLEIGCGAGIDLVRFARGGAKVTGIDIAEVPITLAAANFRHANLPADLRVMDGEDLQFETGSFDVVYAHGVLQYAARPEKIVSEIHRVLRPGGEAILMLYNRYSWLHLASKLTRVSLEHQDAPAFRLFSSGQVRQMLTQFHRTRLVIERFPVRTRLHTGIKAGLFNAAFLPLFQLLPKPLIRPFGWHIMAFARK
jgi:2-polyprenyl-3-methyl-5-hydroxy-6-metoxy-1,4-benzoquinol methylase